MPSSRAGCLRLLHEILDGSRAKQMRARGDAAGLTREMRTHVCGRRVTESSTRGWLGDKLLHHQPYGSKLADSRWHGAMRVVTVRCVDVLLGVPDVPANNFTSLIEHWAAAVPLEHRCVREQKLTCSSRVAGMRDAIADDSNGGRHRSARRGGIPE